MSSQQKFTFQERPTILDRYNRMSARWLSGASQDIIDQLPLVDVKPYARIGYMNLAITVLSTLAAVGLFYTFYQVSVTVLVIAAYVLAIIFAALLVSITKTLLDSEEIESKTTMAFIAWVFLFLIIISGFTLLSSNQNRVENTRVSAGIYDSLNVLKRKIDMTRPSFQSVYIDSL